MPDRPLEFTTRLDRIVRGVPFFSVLVPAAVSKAIGRRGNVPVVAKINGLFEVRASIVPCGNGRHRLHLNATTRRLVKADAGDRVSVALSVDHAPVADPTPADLARALREEEDALAAFERFPVGKRNHIIAWIEEAVADTTRAKRVAKALEVALAAREKALDRARGR